MVLKVTKGLVNVSHSYSEVEFGKPGSLGNMTLPPRGESCNRTRCSQARGGDRLDSPIGDTVGLEH